MKSEPGEGEAVRVTSAPSGYSSSQKTPQEIRPGLEVTVPEPVPSRATVSLTPGGSSLSKVAVTSRASLIVTLHLPSGSESQPLQPLNSEPGSASALRVTLSPSSYWALQVAPQSMPTGELVTVPVPEPSLLTVRRNSGSGST